MESPFLLMLVEDNEDDVFLMCRALKKAEIQHPLQIISDGQQAIDYLAGTGPYADRTRFPMPCMVLLDLKLPTRSGLEVLRWIRAQPALYKLVVVMLTSSKETRDVEEAYFLGANSYLVKPATSVDLLETLKALKLYWLTYNQFPEFENDRSPADLMD